MSLKQNSSCGKLQVNLKGMDQKNIPLLKQKFLVPKWVDMKPFEAIVRYTMQTKVTQQYMPANSTSVIKISGFFLAIV